MPIRIQPTTKLESAMWKNIGYEECLAFINCQLNPQDAAHRAELSMDPAITISRMAGSGGRTVATALAEFMQDHCPGLCHWTVFDKNLMEKVLEDHHLPKRIAEFAPEGHKPMMTDIVEEMLGLHPSSWTLVQHTVETILRLAQMGRVILVGRGANVITSQMENVFHVRLVGTLEKRIERVQQAYDLTRHDAVRFIEKEDRGRRRYLKDHFHKDIDDPTIYHLVVNTDRISHEATAALIGNAVMRQFRPNHRVAAGEKQERVALQP
jgi:cytidylate kinase